MSVSQTKWETHLASVGNDNCSTHTAKGNWIDGQDSETSSLSIPSLPDDGVTTLGRYQLIRRLGAGAMGHVWLAYDPQLDRQVAIKRPLENWLADGVAAERFRREAKALSKLNNPHICQVYDIGEEGGLFFAMEYVRGTTLEQWSKQNTELRPEDWVRIVATLAAAIHEAHQLGIVHRDLKPSNIMVRSDGRPVIMDFGLSVNQTAGHVELTAPGEVLGTPAYMAPEQASGQVDEIGPWSDVYSLGLILYRMLTGKFPFPGRTRYPWVFCQKMPSPAKLNADISPAIARVCLRALDWNAKKRYQSAAEFKEALEAALAAPASTGTRKRWRGIAIGATVLVFATATLAALPAMKPRIEPTPTLAPVPQTTADAEKETAADQAPQPAIQLPETSELARAEAIPEIEYKVLLQKRGQQSVQEVNPETTIRIGDALRIEAQSQNAYFYAFWFTRNGLDRIVWPDPQYGPHTQHLRDHISIPPQENRGWELGGEPGPELVLVAASRVPLTADQLAAFVKEASQHRTFEGELVVHRGPVRVVPFGTEGPERLSALVADTAIKYFDSCNAFAFQLAPAFSRDE